MKCPKCDYLGFETGDRCRNCGYDFSLIPAPSDAGLFDPDLVLHTAEKAGPVHPVWDGAFNRPSEPSEPTSPAAARRHTSAPTFPLFPAAFDDGSDEPLISLPASPRPPLAVRRTPDTPRLRAVPKRARAVEVEPELEFTDANPPVPSPPPAVAPPSLPSVGEGRAVGTIRLTTPSGPLVMSAAGPRVAAAALDHLLLGGIDMTVVYFTLRMAGLPMSRWFDLPLAPLVTFLMLLKLAYFCVFTAVGGQTIGKMALRLRVVRADHGALDAGGAALRSLAGTLSAALLGLGYVPVLVGGDRRALHDRLVGTRVVALPPA